jgi:hypothetical protein
MVCNFLYKLYPKHSPLGRLPDVIGLQWLTGASAPAEELL